MANVRLMLAVSFIAKSRLLANVSCRLEVWLASVNFDAMLAPAKIVDVSITWKLANKISHFEVKLILTNVNLMSKLTNKTNVSRQRVKLL